MAGKSTNVRPLQRGRLLSSAWILLAIVVAGCSTNSRYSMDTDAAPDVEFDVGNLPDPVPVYEPPSRGGNKSPYTVWGRSYHVLPTAEGYREHGGASWYGAKFHGHKTSNGEIYNMYEMSAAHKTLPLPTYVKVTNLDNGRSVVVRVNDRGPFHEGRIIDLSYAAAKKLGYYAQGTAQVEVEAITVSPSATAAQQATPPQIKSDNSDATGHTERLASGYGYFIQVGAFSSMQAAQQLKQRLDATTQQKAFVTTSNDTAKVFHRVRMGPFYDLQQARVLLQQLEQSNIGSPMIITRPVQRTG